jgi:putative ABC transport system substrate-binding protein
MMRRQFISAVGVVAWSLSALWPFATHAQKQSLPIIGFVNFASPTTYDRQLAAFLRGLKETGYVDGQNVTVAYRWAEGQSDKLPDLIAELIHKPVTVIAATSTPASVAAAKKATSTRTPIVFETGSDPVRLGLVDSLSRPGGNITGVTQANVEMAAKRLQLLHEVLPSVTVVGLLSDPSNPGIAEMQRDEVSAAASTLGITLHIVNATNDAELDAAFARLHELKAGGVVIGGGPFLISKAPQTAALSARYAMPSIFEFRDFVAAGGLMSYGSDITDSYRLAGVYVGRVLNGTKPADLPVQQATKVEFYINLKTAKTLGLTVPAALQARADEMIE